MLTSEMKARNHGKIKEKSGWKHGTPLHGCVRENSLGEEILTWDQSRWIPLRKSGQHIPESRNS